MQQLCYVQFKLESNLGSDLWMVEVIFITIGLLLSKLSCELDDPQSLVQKLLLPDEFEVLKKEV